MSTLDPQLPKGFWLAEDWMAGVAHTQAPLQYYFYVVNTLEGTWLHKSPSYSTVDEAITELVKLRPDWTFESVSGCGSGDCGTGSGCKQADKGCQGEKCGPSNCKVYFGP